MGKAAGDLQGLELEAQLKLLSEELKVLSISAVKKSLFRDLLADYSKKIVAWKKQNVLEQTQKALKCVVDAAESSASDKVVCRFDFGVDGKVAKSIMTSFGKQIKNKAFLLISADTGADKFMVIAHAPKGVQNIDCKAWVSAATEGTGGKGGGKKDSAQFTVQGIDQIDGVLEKAKNI